MARLCTFVGLPAPLSRIGGAARELASSAGFSFSGGDRSSYNSCASTAGPRLLPISKTFTTLMALAWGKVRTSPLRIFTLDLAMSVLLIRTFLLCTNFAAKLRLLKNRENHNQRSTRIVVPTLCLPTRSLTSYLDFSALQMVNADQSLLPWRELLCGMGLCFGKPLCSLAGFSSQKKVVALVFSF